LYEEQALRITRLRVKNFLSLKDVDLELGKLNVFIGPNTSGKSNIARAFQLLANHVRYGVPILPGYKGFRMIAYGFDETSQIEFDLHMKKGEHDIRYKLLLTHDNYVEKAWINNVEALSSEGKNIRAFILTRNGETKEFIWSTLPSTSQLLNINVYKSLLAISPVWAAREILELAETLRSITVHSFVPKMIRATSQVTEQPELGYDGSRLARVLLKYHLEDRRTFSLIEDVLRSLIPEVEEIIPHLEGTNVELWLRVKGLREPLRPANISDGTLRILAYITALYSTRSLAVIEEPENSIHPRLLGTIVDLARKAPCQVIITTHSPYLLDHVKPEEVFVVEKPELETMVKKLAKTKEVEAVKRLLIEGGTLGEAWYSGLIGGTP